MQTWSVSIPVNFSSKGLLTFNVLSVFKKNNIVNKIKYLPRLRIEFYEVYNKYVCMHLSELEMFSEVASPFVLYTNAEPIF